MRLPDDELLRWLREDAPHGDLTTDALGIGGRAARLEFSTRSATTLCATEEAARLFELCGARARVHAGSGESVAAETPVLEAEGSAAALHLAWKVAQTAVEYASGIAGAARALVRAVREAGSAAQVACTRKNFPGTKALSLRAVRAGGAIAHRLGLSETVLVFPEHRSLIEADEPPAALVARLRQTCPERRLVFETGAFDDAVELARAGAEVVQLERFSPQQVAALRAALAALAAPPLLAVAGGVTCDNAAAYARAGADLLVSSAPYLAPPADVRVRFAAVTP